MERKNPLFFGFFGFFCYNVACFPFRCIFNLHNSARYLVTSVSGSPEIRSGPARIRNEGDVLFDKENGNNICSLSYRRIIRLSRIISYDSLSKGRLFLLSITGSGLLYWFIERRNVNLFDQETENVSFRT